MRSREAMVQLLQKANRLEWFKDHNMDQCPRSVSCSNCRQPGHYYLTCPSACSVCGAIPHSDHLGKLVSILIPIIYNLYYASL